MATPIPLRSLNRRSLEDRAADELRQALVSRQYPPGARLTEMRLSAEMAVSRGTVRSALQKLLTEGLVAQRPYASWEVVGLTEEDAWELFTLRAALEGLGAEVVTAGVKDGRIDPAPIRQAFSLLDQACASGASDEQVDAADFHFHKAVITAAGHRRLLTQYERVAAQLQMLIVAANNEPRASTRLVEAHRPMLDVLFAGDPERAGALFRRHAWDAYLDVKAQGIDGAGAATASR